VLPEIPRPSSAARQAATERWDQLIKPTHALGSLETLGIWAAGVQDTCPPHLFAKPHLLLFVGDHGVARTERTSAYPPEITAQMVRSFLTGTAAINVLARLHDVDIQVIDVSVDAPPDYVADLAPAIANRRIRRGSGSINIEDAMSIEEAEQAFALGAQVANDVIDAGAELLIVGDMGIGNTTPAATLTGLITGHDAVRVTGLGTGIDDNTWMRKCAAIRDAMRRGRPHLTEPMHLLAAVSGPDIAAMAGCLHQSAARRTPVLLDGLIPTSAALVVHRMNPKASQWWQAGHLSAEPAHALALDRLDLKPIIDAGMHLGEGSGACIALPILQSAVACLSEMATFDEAGLTTPDG